MAVVGGGIVGTAIAIRAAREGLTVALAERGAICGEATSASAGLICAQYDAHADTPLFRYRLDGRAAWPEFVDVLTDLAGAPVEYRRTPTLRLAWEDSAATLRARVTWQQAAGLEVIPLTPNEACRLEPAIADDVALAALFPGDVQVNTQRLAPVVTRALRAVGVSVRQHTTVRELRRDGGGHILITDGEPIAADQVVIAAGSWCAALLPDLPVGPSKGQMLELEAGDLELRHIVISPDGGVTPRADGRLVVGATKEDVGFTPGNTAAGVHAMLGAAIRAIPRLAAHPIRAQWFGYRPATPDDLPVVGAHAPSGTIVASGHSTHGVTMSWLTAGIVTNLLVGKPPGYPIEPFAPGRFVSPTMS